eukprot:5364019-Prymnesium_polylepis.1
MSFTCALLGAQTSYSPSWFVARVPWRRRKLADAAEPSARTYAADERVRGPRGCRGGCSACDDM